MAEAKRGFLLGADLFGLAFGLSPFLGSMVVSCEAAFIMESSGAMAGGSCAPRGWDGRSEWSEADVGELKIVPSGASVELSMRLTGGT